MIGDSKFVTYYSQARYYRAGGNANVTRVVIHDMEYPLGKKGAEWCVTPETRILLADLSWLPADKLVPGDELVGVDEYPRGSRGRCIDLTTITRLTRRDVPCVRVTLVDGAEVTCSTDHRWLAQDRRHKTWIWDRAEDLRPNQALMRPWRPWERDLSYPAGYLAGAFDGEGSMSRGKNRLANGLTFHQMPGDMLDRVCAYLDAQGFTFSRSQRRDGLVSLRVAGLGQLFTLLGTIGCARFVDLPWRGRRLYSRTKQYAVDVAKVEAIGIREVVSFETDMHTYVAEGIVAHNCADYFHGGERVASAHYCVDEDSVAQSVREADIAFHAPPNTGSIGIEQAGYTSLSRPDWLGPHCLPELKLSAKLCRDICLRHNIPMVYLSIADLLAGKHGITTHNNVSEAWHQSTHNDPGPNFPMDLYIQWVKEQPQEDNDMLAVWRESDGKVYTTTGGHKDHIPSEKALVAAGFDPKKILAHTDPKAVELAKLPELK